MSDQLTPGPWLAIHEELGVQPPEFDDRPLGAFVEMYAKSMPDAGAMRYMGRTVSYRELNQLTNELANGLATLGIVKGNVVGLHLPNTLQYGIALLALSKLGAVGTGISPLMTSKEVASLLESAGVKVLISLDTLAKSILEPLGRLPQCVESLVVTGVFDLIEPAELSLPALESIHQTSYLELTTDSSTEFTQIDLPDDHVFLIQFTGGTTGKPKGAMLTMRGIMYNCLVGHLYRPWKPGAETPFTALPPTHIGGAGVFFWSIRFGAHLVIIPDARDIDHYCQQMIECPPTRLFGVPTLYQMIADHPLSATIDFSGVVYAQTGAAPITGESRKRIEDMLQGCVLSDGYGMTEGGPTVTVNPPDRCNSLSVGIPLPSVDVRIVDVETGTQEMPYGEAGEIIIASPSLMKGYLNNPQETANSLREWRGKLWMHSGDIGTMDAEGYVCLKDRAKDMIIVSGFKVFSVEVEDKLSSHEYVASCALIGSPDPKRPGSEIVNLYLELTPQAKSMDPSQVKAHIFECCRAELSAYKVPRRIHIIDVIPLTPVGKIDKKALRTQAAV